MKLVIFWFVVMCATATFATRALTDKYYVDENDTQLYYRAEDGFITLTECSGLGNGRNLNLPASIEGLKVVSIADDFLNGARQYWNGRTWGDIVIPEGITNIGDRAFYQLEFHSCAIPKSVVSIGDSAFDSCTCYGDRLNLSLPNVQVIGNKVFSSCLFINSVMLTANNLKVGTEAFRGCDFMKSVTLPNSLERISDGMFYTCFDLEAVNIPTSVTSIGACAFMGCRNLASFTLPNGLTWIGEEAFRHCTSVKKISVPSSVETIGARAFYGCGGVQDLVIENGVVEIGDEAFGELSITSVTIPKSVRRIGAMAFSEWRPILGIDVQSYEAISDLSIYVDPENDNYKSVDGVLFSKDGLNLELYPSVKKRGNPFSFGLAVNGTFKTPDGIARVGKMACARRRNSRIEVQEGVTNVDAYAFADSQFDTMKLPSTLKLIAEYAFSGCEAFDLAADDCGAVVVPPNVMSIGKGAFSNSDISKLELPNLMTEVPIELCKDCDRLVEVHISTNAIRIGAEAFASCVSMTNFVIPDSVEQIDDYAFSQCTSLSRIDFYGTFPKDIGVYAFYGCPSDMEIHVRKSWGGDKTWRGYTVVADLAESSGEIQEEELEYSFYYNEDGITLWNVNGDEVYEGALVIPSLYEGNRVTCLAGSIGYTKSGRCHAFTKVIIPSSVKRIEDEAFDEMETLTEVVLNEGLVEIGEDAFLHGNISVAKIPSTVRVIGAAAFGQNPLDEILVADGNECYFVQNDLLIEKATKRVQLALRYAGDVVIPEGVEVVRRNSFEMDEITSVTFPSTLKKLEPSALSYGKWFTNYATEYDFSKTSLEFVGGAAFAGNSKLITVKFPSTLKTLRAYAFAICNNLKSVYFEGAKLDVSFDDDDDGINGVKHFCESNGKNPSVFGSDLYVKVWGKIEGVTSYVLRNKGWDAFVVNGLWQGCPIAYYENPNDGGPSVHLTPDQVEDWLIDDLAPTFAAKYGESESEYRKRFKTSFGSDYAAAFLKQNGKIDAQGNAMYVWQDYVAGTDPTDPNDVFRVESFSLVNGVPVIQVHPDLGEKRVYKTFGSNDLSTWKDAAGNEANFNFFKVTVEMTK